LKRDCEIVYKAYFEFLKRIRQTKKKLQEKKILPYVLKNLEAKKINYYLKEPLTIGMAGKKVIEMYL
jgi:hypothetical protein